MCGIAGIFEFNGLARAATVQGMIDSMAHRGPDGEGVWSSRDGRMCLGHRRLAIIDLSPAGAQPMVSADGKLAVTFNGEIYNYQALRRELADGWEFKSNSDTEVLLAGYRRWGRELAQHLVGMFALALWEEDTKSLYLARDRAGEKPLYYAATGSRFIFASEIKALLQHPAVERRLDWSSAIDFLQYGYPLGERSFLEGVKKLPPAHCALVTERDCKIWCYWSATECGKMEKMESVETLDQRFHSLLGEAVQAQLVADVPVGILLSGGVDSSLIAALAVAKSRGPVRTFTITFPESPELDESGPARLVARHLGTEHIELEGRLGGPDLLPTLARQFDEPLGDSSQIPTYLVSKLARQHCTVVLGGDGGDELFGGYRHYNTLLQPRRLPAFACDAIAATARYLFPFGYHGRNFAMGLASEAKRPRVIPRLFDRTSLARLVGRERLESASRHEARATPPSVDVLTQALLLDFENYLPGDILTKVDRASMLTSLEVRAPFLDHRLVEFAFRDVPSRLKTTADRRKILPKRLAQRLLPAGFDLERKQGFSVPMRLWMRGEWGRFMFSVLREAPGDLFSKKYVESLIRGQQHGRSNGEALFALTMFELWRREYRVGCS